MPVTLAPYRAAPGQNPFHPFQIMKGHTGVIVLPVDLWNAIAGGRPPLIIGWGDPAPIVFLLIRRRLRCGLKFGDPVCQLVYFMSPSSAAIRCSRSQVSISAL
jgi:hypothetical protein